MTGLLTGLHRKVAGGFGAILIVTGLLGFVVPADKALMSGAPAYDAFHLVFGLVGLLCAWAGARPSRAFCLGFGALDLYQAVAQLVGWWPLALFRWTAWDAGLHWALGAALVALALAPRGARL